MRDFSKTRRGHSRGYELFRLVVGICAVIVLALLAAVSTRAAWNMYDKFVQSSEGRETAEQRLGSLQEKEKRISAAVAALTSSRGVEAEIRERFGVAKPGEGEIKIVRDKKDATESGTESKNLWQRIVDVLFIW